MSFNRRIRTFLYEDQRFSDAELDLLHTPALQRLYDLHQLGLTDRVFVDASHTRFSHVIGVMDQADKLLSSIERNLRKQPNLTLSYENVSEDNPPTRRDVARMVRRRTGAVRLMALLHDLTHAPYGHTLEDEIELVEQKHDEPARQAEAFFRLLAEWLIWQWKERDKAPKGSAVEEQILRFENGRHLNHELSTDTDLIDALVAIGVELCDKKTSGTVSRRAIGSTSLIGYLKNLAYAFRALFHLEIAHKLTPQDKHFPAHSYPVDEILRRIFDHVRVRAPLSADESFNPHRDAFLLDIIGNTICADLLDYAQRDARMAGLRLDYDARRIIENFTVVSVLHAPEGKSERTHPFEGRSLRTAISLFSHKFRLDTLGEIAALLQVRYYVYERMLFHPTKCVAGACLGAAIQWLGFKRLPLHYQGYGDAVFLHEVREAALVVQRLLISLEKTADYKKPFSKNICDKLVEQLPAWSDIGLILSVRHLLNDNVATVAHALKKFEFQRFIGGANTPKRARVLKAAYTALKKASENDPKALFELNNIAAHIPKSVEQTEVLAYLSGYSPNIEQLVRDLQAGLRLLDMLSARRYPQRIFNLLPGELVAKDEHWTTPKIAAHFRNALCRQVAEREIESRAKLPPGSVVIHCPPATGPVKIAQILITHGEHTTPAVSLSNIGQLTGFPGNIFAKHQSMVAALEGMYASTWRLAVSVARPHDNNWEKISPIIGQVLYEIASCGHVDKNHNQFQNDITMVRELQFMADRQNDEADLVKVEFPSGDEELRTVMHDGVMSAVYDRLKQHPLFQAQLGDVKMAASAGSEEQAKNINETLSRLDDILANANNGQETQLPGI